MPGRQKTVAALLAALAVATAACGEGTQEKGAPGATTATAGKEVASRTPMGAKPRVVAELDVNQPGGIAFAFGSVWVPSHVGELVRIDPKRNKIEAVIPRVGAGGVTPAFGSIWLGGSLVGERMTRIDPSRNDVVAVIPGTMDPDATAFGSVWASVWGDEVVRINPRTNRIVATVKVGDGTQEYDNSVAVREGSVYVLLEDEDVVARIDPKTNRVAGRIEIPPSALGPFGPDDKPAWLTTDEGLRQVDLRTGEVLTEVPLRPEQVGDLAVVDDTFWVVSDETITEVDAKRAEVVKTHEAPLSGGLEDAAFGFGDLWLSYYGWSKVLRVELGEK